MAKWAIFNGQGRVFKLASNDSIKDSFIEKAGEGSVAKEINDSQWNDIASNTKIVSLVNNSVQIEEITQKLIDLINIHPFSDFGSG